jgi:hypothetical protein
LFHVGVSVPYHFLRIWLAPLPRRRRRRRRRRKRRRTARRAWWSRRRRRVGLEEGEGVITVCSDAIRLGGFDFDTSL